MTTTTVMIPASPLAGIDATLRTASTPFPHAAAFLPAATVQCHASNLLLLADGDLLCAWFGGSQEGKPDISIYLSRLRSGSNNWLSAEKMTFDETRSEQNPVLFEAPSPSNELWLMYTSQKAGNQDSAVVKRRVSSDGGSTWSEPQVLFPEAGVFIRQPMVALSSTEWVIPTFLCRTKPGARWVGNDDISEVRVTKDAGKTWQAVTVPNSFGAVHMEIQKLRENKYLALYRSRWADNVYASVSQDAVHWSEPKATALPNPNSGICFDVLPSGRVVIVYNDSSRAKATGRRAGLYDDIAEEGDRRPNQASTHGGKEAFWGAPRAPLCLGWSDDDGQTWSSKIIQEGDGYCMTNDSEKKLNRELSYPSMMVDEDGTMHIAFTFWRQAIKYLRIGSDIFK